MAGRRGEALVRRGKGSAVPHCASKLVNEENVNFPLNPAVDCLHPESRKPRSELYGVIAVDHGSVVLEFVMVLMVSLGALVVAAAGESRRKRDGGVESTRLGYRVPADIESASRSRPLSQGPAYR